MFGQYNFFLIQDHKNQVMNQCVCFKIYIGKFCDCNFLICKSMQFAVMNIIITTFKF